jgi:hypothetical protein
MRLATVWLPLLLALVPGGCKKGSASTRANPTASASAEPIPSASSATTDTADAAPLAPVPTTPDPKRYTWLEDKTSGEVPAAVDTLQSRFATPSGATRVAVEAGSFGEWLRNLPLAAPGTPSKNFKGDVVYPGDDQYLGAVIAIDIGKIDLQQSPDVVIRLHAEWLFSQGNKDITYRGATGLDMPLSKWARGERMDSQGASVFWVMKSKPSEIDHAEFRRYLNAVFTWANSTSLAQQAEAIAADELRPGDFFVHLGSPGHALVVLDVARKPKGPPLALLGQALNPSENPFVLQLGKATAWFSLRAPGPIITPHTKEFPWEGLRRLGIPKPPG